MFIDIIYLVIILVALIKGLRRGFIVAIFSIIAIVIGLAAAIKLSVVAAMYLTDTVNVSAKWLPVLSFAIVFILVVFLVRAGAKLLEKAVEVVFLGWLNRLGGALVYASLYTIIFSVLLFFAEQLHVLKEDSISNSKVYVWVRPVGPYVMDGIGTAIPFFRDMFLELQTFFDKTSKVLPAK